MDYAIEVLRKHRVSLVDYYDQASTQEGRDKIRSQIDDINKAVVFLKRLKRPKKRKR